MEGSPRCLPRQNEPTVRANWAEAGAPGTAATGIGCFAQLLEKQLLCRHSAGPEETSTWPQKPRSPLQQTPPPRRVPTFAARALTIPGTALQRLRGGFKSCFARARGRAFFLQLVPLPLVGGRQERGLVLPLRNNNPQERLPPDCWLPGGRAYKELRRSMWFTGNTLDRRQVFLAIVPFSPHFFPPWTASYSAFPRLGCQKRVTLGDSCGRYLRHSPLGLARRYT